ncbi:hypothetical protein COT12_00080 [Candidatus Berkelbacteria bacterium CG08_land_8_20_14_0_20_39_8]|uniref:Sucrose phosphatase-like domain-containing protein n=1 Tax=Candidatus Berkelbacteria bacterium CG08_land_8_20_14_0_20_39_8 TaxID=1974511 RepID=A0A2M6YD44_9BACT|nr:MAG: hypothetical protein COT12_00080 [Candidatus Berkelbacteria bacterium CG08_land_8_20_14_0_20_39_8]
MKNRSKNWVVFSNQNLTEKCRILYDRYMNNQRSAAFLDIDGCLTPGKNRMVHRHNLWMIQETLESLSPNFEYIIVTARPAPYAEAVMQFLGLFSEDSFRHAICESGGVTHLFGSNDYSNASEVNPVGLIELEGNLRAVETKFNFKLEDGRKRTICLIPTEGTSSDLASAVCQIIPQTFDLHLSVGGVDIVPAGMDKSKAILELARRHNINLQSAIAIGDSSSDLKMLALVGSPACPINANSQVKKMVSSRCGYISNFESVNGVADILRHFAFCRQANDPMLAVDCC